MIVQQSPRETPYAYMGGRPKVGKHCCSNKTFEKQIKQQEDIFFFFVQQEAIFSTEVLDS